MDVEAVQTQGQRMSSLLGAPAPAPVVRAVQGRPSVITSPAPPPVAPKYTGRRDSRRQAQRRDHQGRQRRRPVMSFFCRQSARSGGRVWGCRARRHHAEPVRFRRSADRSASDAADADRRAAADAAADRAGRGAGSDHGRPHRAPRRPLLAAHDEFDVKGFAITDPEVADLIVKRRVSCS